MRQKVVIIAALQHRPDVLVGGVLMLLTRLAVTTRVGTAVAAAGTAVVVAALNKATYWRIQRLERR